MRLLRHLSIFRFHRSSSRGVAAVVAVVVVAVVVVVVALCSDPGEWVSVKWLAWGLLSAVFLFVFLSFFLSFFLVWKKTNKMSGEDDAGFYL